MFTCTLYLYRCVLLLCKLCYVYPWLLVAVMSDKGIKMSEWNKTLPHPLTDAGLSKLIKAGFSNPDDVALVEEEAIHELDLSLRDKAVLKKIIAP